MNTKTGRWMGLAFVVAASAALIGLGMGRLPLLDPDEAKHAEAAREMFLAGRWLEPLVVYRPYHHKPSLFYVLMGLCYRLFGVGEFAVRLLPALAAVVTVAAVYLHAARESIRQGLLAATLLLSSALFVGVGRFANFDGLLTCITTLAVLSFARWLDTDDERRCSLTIYLLAGIGVLVKGPAVAVIVGAPVVATAAYFAYKKNPTIDVRLLEGALAAAIVVALWAVPVWILYPDYLYEFVWTHNLRRFWAGDADMFHPEPFWFFVPVMFLTMLPWSVLLPATLLRIREATRGQRFLAAFAVWVVAFFSCSTGKLAPYILPAYPPLALVVADWLDRSARDPLTLERGSGLLRFVGAFYVLLTPAAFVALAIEAPQFEYAAMVLVPASLVGLTLAFRRAIGDGSARALAIRLCAATVGTYILMLAWLADDVGRFTSDRDLAMQAIEPDRPRTTVAYRVRPYSYLFYSGRPLVYKVSDQAYAAALANPHGALLLTKDRHLEAVRALAPGLDFVEIARNYRHVLLSASLQPDDEDPGQR